MQPKHTSTLKPKKFSSAPKKPSGAYIFYCKSARQTVKGDHPEFDLAAVGKELGRRWQALPMEEKKPFFDMAAQDKMRYERDLVAYSASLPR